jgi:predicted small metal-binding protein
MVAFKCKDIGMDCKYETTAANVQELDEKVAQHAREAHKIASLDKDMWIKIHKAEK